MKAAAYALLLLVILVLSAPGFSQAPDDKLIVPGQRIGKWTLDMTIDDLVRANGAKNTDGSQGLYAPVVRMWTLSPDWVETVWFHQWSNVRLSAGTLGESSQRVVVLATSSKDYKTAQGIAAGSRRQDVEVAYGKPTATVASATGPRDIYDASGFYVRIRASVVEHVMIFRPGTAKQIWKF